TTDPDPQAGHPVVRDLVIVDIERDQSLSSLAVSTNISSSGSRIEGRYEKYGITGSTDAAQLSTKRSMSSLCSLILSKCSGRLSTASYSSIIATLASGTIAPSQAAISNSRDAPAGLFNPLRTTSVSKTTLI